MANYTLNRYLVSQDRARYLQLLHSATVEVAASKERITIVTRDHQTLPFNKQLLLLHSKHLHGWLDRDTQTIFLPDFTADTVLKLQDLLARQETMTEVRPGAAELKQLVETAAALGISMQLQQDTEKGVNGLNPGGSVEEQKAPSTMVKSNLRKMSKSMVRKGQKAGEVFTTSRDVVSSNENSDQELFSSSAMPATEEFNMEDTNSEENDYESCSEEVSDDDESEMKTEFDQIASSHSRRKFSESSKLKRSSMDSKPANLENIPYEQESEVEINEKEDSSYEVDKTFEDEALNSSQDDELTEKYRCNICNVVMRKFGASTFREHLSTQHFHREIYEQYVRDAAETVCRVEGCGKDFGEKRKSSLVRHIGSTHNKAVEIMLSRGMEVPQVLLETGKRKKTETAESKPSKQLRMEADVERVQTTTTHGL